jgi:hypothetical protein
MKMETTIYDKWANAGLKALANFWDGDISDKTIIQITMSACVCADLDRRHKKTITQALQSFSWAYSCATNETSLERYLNSGYFDQEYLKKVLTNLK